MPALLNSGIVAAACLGLIFLQDRAFAVERPDRWQTADPGTPPRSAESSLADEFVRTRQRPTDAPVAPGASRTDPFKSPAAPGANPGSPAAESAAALEPWVHELVRDADAESSQRQIAELTRTAERQSFQLQQRELQLLWLWSLLGAGTLALLLAVAWLLRLRRARTQLERTHAQAQRSHRELQASHTSLEQRLRTRSEELARQTTYLQTLIDNLPFRIWLQDRDCRYLAVNQAYAETCGRIASELVGKSAAEVWPVELAAVRQAEDTAVMASGEQRKIEHSDTGPEGVRCLETYRIPVRTGEGSVLGAIGICCDISDRKAAEAARDQALNEAVRLARMRSEFLDHMSHELRTPLNSILGYAQLLQREPASAERQRTGLDVIRQSGQHLLAVINDMLEFTRIEAGKLELAPAETRLRPLLEAIAGMIGGRAQEKGLEFRLELAPDLPEQVALDKQRLRQVLLNLLGNAVKFTDRGRITLRAMPVGAGRLRFEIEDTGSGIAPHLLEPIFQPFEQVGDLRQRVGGTGLGLAISRQYVRLMGGDIGVESRLEQGSTFYFEVDGSTTQPHDDALRPESEPLQQSPASGPLAIDVPLPLPHATRFLELARRGNMRELIAWADQLQALGPNYVDAAGLVRRLAADYESGQLLELAQRCAAAPA